MGLRRWLGLTPDFIDVPPVEASLFRPRLPPDHPDAVAELEALLEARRLMAGEPLDRGDSRQEG